MTEQLILQATKKTSVGMIELEQSIRYVTANARNVRVNGSRSQTIPQLQITWRNLAERGRLGH